MHGVVGGVNALGGGGSKFSEWWGKNILVAQLAGGTAEGAGAAACRAPSSRLRGIILKLHYRYEGRNKV